MDRGHLLRRAIHMMTGLAPLYYVVPEEIPYIGIPRWSGLIIFLGAIVAIEVLRLRLGVTFLGLRQHEAKAIASCVWTAAGITVALWVFPHDIASASIVGMALVDPLAGEIRKMRGDGQASVLVPILAYSLVSAVVLSAFGYRDWRLVAVLSLVGAVSAVAAERWKVPRVDDDFLMIVVPGLLMWALSEI